MGICKSKEYTLDEKVEFLRNTPFFLHMSHRRLQHFGNYFQVRQYRKGEHIYKQDEKGDEFFILAKGEVKMWARGPNKKEQFLCTKKTGDFFGERAVTEASHVRPATVRCTVDTLVMFINSVLWRKYLLQAGDQMANMVTKILGEKMSELLKKISFLSTLSDWKLELLGNLFRYDTLEEGEHVFEEGDLGRELYIVSHGSVRVTAKDNEGHEVLFQSLKAGDYFGEIALMIDMPRTATVTANERCLLLVLGLEDFRNFLNIVPDLKENFEQAVRERITKTLKKFKVPFFQSIPQSRFHELASICSIHKCEPKDVIFKEGDPGIAFYLIVHGEVKVVDEREGKVLSRLSGGAYFGEIALVTDKPRTATVIADKRAVLLCITKKDFVNFFFHNEEAYAEFAIKLSRYDVPLDSVLLHPTGLKYFQEHVESEYSAENLHCFLAIKKYRESKAQDLEEEAKKIINTYIIPDQAETVNIPDYMRKEILKKMEGKVTPNMFDMAKSEVLKLMSADSFKRFKTKETFKALLDQVGSYEDQDTGSGSKRRGTVQPSHSQSDLKGKGKLRESKGREVIKERDGKERWERESKGGSPRLKPIELTRESSFTADKDPRSSGKTLSKLSEAAEAAEEEPMEVTLNPMHVL